MKKTVIALLLTFCTSWPTHAATDPKTIDFLESVNSQYYCLSRQGVTHFTADVALTVNPQTENEMEDNNAGIEAEINTLSYGVSVSSDGKVEVTFMPSSATNGDSETDKIAIGFGTFLTKSLKNYLKHWSHCMMEPLFHNYGNSKTYTVQNTPDGFTVFETFKEGTLTENFDHQSKLLDSVEQSEKDNVASADEFSKTAQGYRLDKMRRTVEKGNIIITYEYQTIGNHTLLQKIRAQDERRKEFQGLSMGLSCSFTFSNYKFNQ